MTDIFVGSVAVGVVPDARGWNDKLRQQIVEPSKAIGDEAGTEMSKAITDKMGQGGDDSAGAFEREFKKKIKAALADLPKAKLDGDTTSLDLKLEEIRVKIDDIRKEDVIDPAKAAREIDTIMFEITKLRLWAHENKIDIPANIDFNTKKLMTDLAAIRGLGQAGTKKGGLLSSITNAETAIQTAAGSVGAATGIWQSIANLFGGKGGGGGGGIAADVTGAAGGGGGGGLIASVKGIGGSIASGIVPAIIGALILGAPFIGQAIGGAIISVLGGGLAGIGIAGAFAGGKLTKPVANVGGSLQKDLITIGAPAVGPIKSILATLVSTAQVLTPFFANVTGILFGTGKKPGPITLFLETLTKAFENPSVTNSIVAVGIAFGKIVTAMTPDVVGGMSSFADSITRLASGISSNPKAFADFVNFLVQVSIFAVSALAALTDFGNYIETTFSTNITDMSNFVNTLFTAFIGFWDFWDSKIYSIGKSIVTGIENGITDALKGIGNWLYDNFYQPVVNALKTNFGIHSPATTMVPIGKDIVAGILLGITTAWTNVKNFFTKTVPQNFRNWFSAAITWLIQPGKNIVTGLWHGMTSFWSNTVKPFFTKTIPQNLSNWFSTAITWLEKHGEDIITGLWNGMTSLWNNHIRPWFVNLPSTLQGYFTSAINWLWNAGWNIASGIGTGIKSFLSTIDSNWVNTNIFQPLKKAVFAYFGMGSPAKKTQPWGANIITGIIHGMVSEGKNIQKFAAKIFGSWPDAIAAVFSKSSGINPAGWSKSAQNMLKSIFGSVAAVPNAIGAAGRKAWAFVSGGSGGVAQWAGTVSKALSMLGLPQSLTGQVLYQIQTESGGNPNAINLTDANAKRGDPSRGLLQTVGNTFSRYHVPGTSMNIYDPLANIAAAINYAVHQYGKTLMSGGKGLGSGRGYDLGGWLPTGVTLAYNMTGKPERVLTADQFASLSAGGTQYHAHFDGLTGAAIESHVRTAFQMMSMAQGNLQRQGRRS